MLEAAECYADIHRRTRGTYSAINAASLFALAGEEPAAAALAKEILPRLTAAPAPQSSRTDRYFHWATLAEAALLLHDVELFRHALTEARGLERRNLWIRARTHNQFLRLIEIRPEFAALIERWHRPSVGLLFDGEPPAWARDLPAPTPRREEPALVFCAGSHWIGHAALERLLARKVSVHVLVEEMSRASVQADAPGDARRGRASVDVSPLYLDPTQGSAATRALVCAQAALGVSVAHALEVGAPWSCWRAQGERIERICMLDRADLEAALRAGAFTPRAEAAAAHAHGGTRAVALLFADHVGYSHFSATQVQQYWSALMPRVAGVLDRHAEQVLLRKTWGDALHAVVTDAAPAAGIATGLLEIAEETWRTQNRVSVPTFRISLHFGLVDQGVDPIENSRSFFGPQLSLAARVEAVAPPGGIYVTEPFAARLMLEGETGYDCSNVGSVQLPKNLGEFRLLSLQRRAA
jgi:class 3 adenylate cyclase